MSKKRFAVFASGWNASNLCEYLSGMEEICKKNNTDIFLFLAYPPSTEYPEILSSELNIYNLPILEEFDGIAVLATSINYPEYLDELLARCKKSGVPTICHGMTYEGLHSSQVDNVVGMEELCAHLFDVHGIKNPAFVAGSSKSEESAQRYETVKRTMAERGLHFNEEFYVTTEWDNLRAMVFVKELQFLGKGFPDAFICANDGLAMAVTVALNELGKNVPDDILVTGFDYIFDSQSFYPSISSVNQQYKGLGSMNAKALFKLIDKKRLTSGETIIPCKFIPGESCGCGHLRDSEATRRVAGRNVFTSRMNDNLIDRTLSIFERELIESQGYDDLKSRFQILIAVRHLMEIDTLHLILDNAAFNDEHSEQKPLKIGYSQDNIVLFSMTDNTLNFTGHCNIHQLVPGYSEESDNHLYTFLPVYESEYNLGYIVVRDRLDLIEKRTLQKYQARLGIVLQNYRSNINLTFINGQLVQQARKDALTNVQNRSAYEADMKRYESFVARKENISFALAMFDVNDLKEVNDEYGHDAGDEYIISSCRLICNTFNNSPVYRIGGDEFLAILVGKDYENRHALLIGFRDIMSSYKSNAHLPPTKQVSIASGMSEYDPKNDKSFTEIFKRADSLMYENKAAMKKER